ncbi:MAG: lipid-A-disaccharide synthase [Bacteroidales bacterium]
MATYLISCGEPSGDLYASALISELARIDPAARTLGLGGERFGAAGGELVADYRGLTVTGLVEALSVLPRSLGVYRQLVNAARVARPDVFVAIDFPDFNFRLAAAMKRLGVPIVYYICPQVWAWRRSRLRTLKRLVDHAIVIFPFEEAIYRHEQIPVTFVGHPLLDLACPTVARSAFLAGARLDPARPVVALLPGSRPNELRALAPVICEAMPLIAAAVPGVQYLVARAPGLEDELFAPFAHPAASSGGSAHPPVAIVEDHADDVLASADVVLTCSGTATVQTAIHQRPMVIMYKLSPLTYRLGKRFVHVDTYGMVNLVAGSRIVPELIQDDLTAERLAAEAISLLTDQDRYRRTTDAVRAARDRLGAPGATARAAGLIADIAAGRRPQ